MNKFQSTKLFDGYSTCFRQWKAEDTHCKFLHGYAISFKVWFEGELDYRNWVWDFGGMKRSKTQIKGLSPKDYFNYLLDHTVVVAQDDPYKALDLMNKLSEYHIPKLARTEISGVDGAPQQHVVTWQK